MAKCRINLYDICHTLELGFKQVSVAICFEKLSQTRVQPVREGNKYSNFTNCC